MIFYLEYLPTAVNGKSSKSDDLSVAEQSEDDTYYEEDEAEVPIEEPNPSGRSDMTRQSHFARKILDKDPSDSVNVIPLSTEKYENKAVDPNSFLQVVGADIKTGSDQFTPNDDPTIKATQFHGIYKNFLK